MVSFEVKIGDVVTIIKGEKNWNDGMNEFIGQTRKVNELCLDVQGLYVYFEYDDYNDHINTWYWRPGMHFIPFVRKTKKLKLKL